MASKIMWATVMFVLGFFWFYLGGRQIILNLTVGLPVSKRLSRAGCVEGRAATPYTVISCIIWLLICAAVVALVLHFGTTHHYIGFLAGAVIALIMWGNKLGMKTRSNVDSFLLVFSRFITDPELRRAVTENGVDGLREALESRGVALDA